jgi:PIN domain nuclease of toxin-antitoxin system
VRLLLDTNVLLWSLAGHARVDHLRNRILDPDNEIHVSVASVWEVAIKAGLGKLDVDVQMLRQAVRDSGYLELPVLGTHAERLANLPAIHRDPFDRMLVAQAQAEPMRLLTSDALLARYGAEVEIV